MGTGATLRAARRAGGGALWRPGQGGHVRFSAEDAEGLSHCSAYPSQAGDRHGPFRDRASGHGDDGGSRQGSGSARGQLLRADPGFGALFLRRRRHGDSAQQHRAVGYQLRQSQGRSAPEDAVARKWYRNVDDREGGSNRPSEAILLELGDWRWHYVNSSSNGIFRKSARSSASNCAARRQNRTRPCVNSAPTSSGSRVTWPTTRPFASIWPRMKPSSTSTPRSADFQRQRSLK